MSFRFEKKTYGWRDLLLPYQCSPRYTVLTIVQKLLTGILCVLLLLLEADFIDKLRLYLTGRLPLRALFPSMCGMIAIIIWKRMGYNLGRFYTKKAQGEIEYTCSRELVRKCACVPYHLLEDRAFQNIRDYLQQNTYESVWRILQQTGNFLLILSRVLGMYLIFLAESVWLGLLMVFITIPFVYFSVRSEKRAEEILDSNAGNKRRADYLAQLLRDSSAAEERTLFHYTGYLNREYEAGCGAYRRGILKGIRQRGKSAVAEAVVLNLIFLLAVIFQTALFLQERISLGMFIALSGGIYDSMLLMYRGMDDTIRGMESGMHFLGRLGAMANVPELEGVNELPQENGFQLEELEFVKVSFRYPRTADYVLKNLDFRMKAGGRYAFVGENGAGKTTIAKLLTGLYDSYEGRILINGRELRDYTQGERKAIFSIACQDSARYEETAAVNIGLGEVRSLEKAGGGAASHVSRAKAAAERLGIYESISALPQGFDTMLGKKEAQGTEISDGQWQQLLMARLLVNPAPVCILDEPAAALDPITESSLYEQLEQINEGKTIISISHRLGSVKQADVIFVLQKGRLVEKGSHEELMLSKGVYAGMYESQSQWYR